MGIRSIRVEGDLAYVPLTKGYEAVIDAADVPLVEGFNWYALVKRRTIYARRDSTVGGLRVTYRMHRVLMGDPEGVLIDHEDGNGLNNRRKNLRVASISQNNQNRRIAPSNRSGFKGVHWQAGKRRWAAQIKVDGKRHHLGRYKTPEAAHAAYCEASKRLHGEFGRAS